MMYVFVCLIVFIYVCLEDGRQHVDRRHLRGPGHGAVGHEADLMSCYSAVKHTIVD